MILIPLEYHEIRMIEFLIEKAIFRNPHELKFLRELPYQKYEYMWDESLTVEQPVKASIWTPSIYRLRTNPYTSRLSIAEHLLQIVPDIITMLHITWEHKRTPFQALINKIIYFNPKNQFIGSENLTKYFKLLEYGYAAVPSYWNAHMSRRTCMFEAYTSEIGVCFTDALEYYKLNNPGVTHV